MDELAIAKGVVVFAWFALAFGIERWRPAADWPANLARSARARIRRWLRNLGLFAINLPLSALFVLPLSAWGAAQALWVRPEFLSGALGLGLDLILLDLWLYAWHRANHEFPFLWRFHRVHHRDEFLDASSALRFHFGEVALSALARLAPIMLLAIPWPSILVFESLVLIAAIFHHANWRLPARPEALATAMIVTPAWHWVHHHARRADTDSHYGTLFTLWDRLFGTTSGTRRFPGMKIGIENEAETDLAGLLKLPFSGRADSRVS